MFATQRPLTLDELIPALAPLGLPVEAELLSGGTFSAVQRVALADGTSVVAKTSVPTGDEPPLLTYESDLLTTERDVLRLVQNNPAIPAPKIVLEDFSREHCPVDLIVSELLPGKALDTVEDSLTPQALASSLAEVGGIFQALHEYQGHRFGYPANEFALGGPTWPAAFAAMIEAAIDDGHAWGVEPLGVDLRAAVDRGAAALAEVTRPSLIHMDLWPGNVLVDPSTGKVNGIVDFERALFGDPLFDFVGANSMIVDEASADIYAGYSRAGGVLPAKGATASGLESAADYRVTLYRLYVTTIQLIEIVPRRFEGDWVAGHRDHLLRQRDVLLERVATAS